MKEIELSNGMKAIVDNQDYNMLSIFKWTAVKRKGGWYAQRHFNQKITPMARFILGVTDPDIIVDHINGNTLDNQRHNLRRATIAQNNWNSKKREGCTSKYKGVTKTVLSYKGEKKYTYWYATIYVNRKRVFLGCFKTEEDAGLAYNNAAKKLHGQFAKLN